MNELIIAYCGIFFGVFFRTFSPAIRKVEKGFKWDHSYSWTAISAFLVSIFIAFLMLPAFPFELKQPILVFPSAFTFGFGVNGVFNEIRKVLFG